MTRRQRWQRIKQWGATVWQALQAGPGVRAGVWWASLASALLVAIAIGGDLALGLAGWLDPVLGTMLCLLFIGLIMLLAAVIAKLLQLLAQLFSWPAFLVLAGTVGMLVTMTTLLLVPIAPVVALLLALGAVLGAASGGRFHQAGWPKQVVIVVVGLVVVVAGVLLLVSYIGRGDGEHLVDFQADPVAVPAIAATDPSQPGPYAVTTLTYGSGDDRRPEYDDGIDLRTHTVDVSDFVKGDKGWQLKLRQWYWGFDLEHCPLNGRVWLPAGDGPFPLVLIVHGNHSMEEHSDPGYAWLGELLASRGFILVSVDENFLNGSWRGGLNRENDARAWVLLEHLRLWHDWSTAGDNLFSGKADLQRIALMGHSRGGEAAAIAGAFNRLSRYPDDATVELDFGFAIQAVIAIAPSDGQYNPAGQPTPLFDLSYLVLQGAHDADCSFFMGSRQYRRVSFASEQSPHFKASVYSYRANHGQFNTVWGDDDWGWPFRLLLNRRPLLDGEQQRRIGGVYISAFLEATLNQRHEYRALFRDHRSAVSWLPEGYLITRFQNPTYRPVADFEEDIDVTTGATEGTTITGTRLAVWREEQLAYRKSGSKRTGVAVLGWRPQEPEPADEQTAEEQHETEEQHKTGQSIEAASVAAPPTYTITFPAAASAGLTADSLLVFALADKGETPPEKDKQSDEDTNEGEPSTEANDDDEKEEDGDDGDQDEEDSSRPLDLSIELETVDGGRARLTLSSVRMLVPDLPSRFSKLPKEGFLFGASWEPTLQSFELPFARFQEQAPGLDPGSLTTIRFIFDRSPEGMVVLDDVGFAEADSTAIVGEPVTRVSRQAPPPG